MSNNEVENVPQHTGPLNITWCSRCLRYVRSLIPVDYKGEVLSLVKIAVPASLGLVMDYSIGLISTVFCGHLGRTELAGVALANAIINVTGVSVGVGLSAACDTLISQTFGSGNVKRVGVILQRAILILLLACFFSWTILMNTQSLLLAISEDPHTVMVSQKYVKIFMIGLPAMFAYQLEARYLQNQEIIWPQVISGVVATSISALTNYIFLFVLGLGVEGSAGANVISQYSMAIILYCYILCKGLHKNTWPGWSKECLQEWGTYIRLAIPCMVMVSIEWWTFEISAFLAGLLSEVELGTQSVVYELSNIAFMFPYGFSIAGSVKVGNALGAGETERAKCSAKLAIVCAGLWIGLLICVFVEAVFFIAYLIKLDWKKATEEALERAGIQVNHTETEDPEEQHVVTGSAEGHSDTNILFEEVDTVAVTTVGRLLTNRELLLRRGLALGVTLSVFTLGVIAHVLLTRGGK